jgi:predicted RNA-binding Zn-ribbon protein involved in translation (DUF1610 family)
MNFILLRTYDNYITANLHLQQLEAEGIRAYLENENIATIAPYLSGAAGGIKLLVFEEQLQRATEIINAIEEEYRKSLPCPKCGNFNIHPVVNTNKASNWFSAIFNKLSVNSDSSFEPVYRCFTCGYEMEKLPE